MAAGARSSAVSSTRLRGRPGPPTAKQPFSHGVPRRARSSPLAGCSIITAGSFGPRSANSAPQRRSTWLSPRPNPPHIGPAGRHVWRQDQAPLPRARAGLTESRETKNWTLLPRPPAAPDHATGVPAGGRGPARFAIDLQLSGSDLRTSNLDRESRQRWRGPKPKQTHSESLVRREISFVYAPKRRQAIDES